MEKTETALKLHSFSEDDLSFTNNFSELSLSPLQQLTVFQNTAAQTSAVSKDMNTTERLLAPSKDLCDEETESVEFVEFVENDQIKAQTTDKATGKATAKDLSNEINLSAQALRASAKRSAFVAKRSAFSAFGNALYSSNKKTKSQTTVNSLQSSPLFSPQVFLVNKATEHLKKIVDELPNADKEANIKDDSFADFQNYDIPESKSHSLEASEDLKQSGLASPFEYKDNVSIMPLSENPGSRLWEKKNDSFSFDGIINIDKPLVSKSVCTKTDIANRPVTATPRSQSSIRKLRKEKSNHILRRRIPRKPRNIGVLSSCGPVSAVKADLNHIVQIRPASVQTHRTSSDIDRAIETASLFVGALNQMPHRKPYQKHPFLQLPPSSIPEFHSTSRAIGDVTTFRPCLGPRSGTMVPLDRLFVASKKAPATFFLSWARAVVFGFPRPVYLNDAGVPYVIYDNLPPFLRHTQQRADSLYRRDPLPL